MKITIMILLFFSLGLSDNPVYDIEYHDDNKNIKSITYYDIRISMIFWVLLAGLNSLINEKSNSK